MNDKPLLPTSWHSRVSPRPIHASSLLILAVAATSSAWLRGADGSDSPPALTWYGDVRLRFEEDWNSQTTAGVERTDRVRGRLRARAGINYRFDEDWTGGIRLRTGNTHSQQSPHLTFASDDGARDDLEFVFDKYFVQFKRGDVSAWAGRNSFPFWQQNEFFWDDDVTPTGVAGSHSANAGAGKLTSTFGAFALPDGGFGLNGGLVSGQVIYTAPAGAGSFTVAAGLHRFFGSEGAEDLRNRNGARDYFIGVLNAQWATSFGEVPLTLGVDFFHNFENYDGAEAAPLPPGNADETLGYVLSAQYRRLQDAGDWQVGYYYAHIETFAVNASFAQDDWVRWGSATQTDGSDAAGHEFRFSYAFSKSLNVVARLFLVDAITSVQDGNRFRADLNWKF